MKEESFIKGSVEPVNMKSTEKILHQMKNCICKIKMGKKYGTGFFCKIPQINMNFLMTNYHVINEKKINENKEINILLNDDKEALSLDLTIKREKYFSQQFDITLIELKENDEIKAYLELDDNILKNKEIIYYEEKSIYILHYLYGKNICVSYGILNKIDNYYIIHICSTDYGSSGSPILNLENNKVIGIHKQGSNNYNKGTLLKYPLNDIIKIYNKNNFIINENKYNKYNNIIIGEINIKENDINKDMKIINSFENAEGNNPNLEVEKCGNEKEIKENIEIKIDEKIIEFTYKYKFKKEGKYKIEYLFKNNLANTCFMFANCDSLTRLDFLNFNTQNVTNMRDMFSHCNSLTNLNLSNFNTQNVTDMSWMFNNCNSLTNLNLSNFNTQNVTDMSFMFFNCGLLVN